MWGGLDYVTVDTGMFIKSTNVNEEENSIMIGEYIDVDAMWGVYIINSPRKTFGSGNDNRYYCGAKIATSTGLLSGSGTGIGEIQQVGLHIYHSTSSDIGINQSLTAIGLQVDITSLGGEVLLLSFKNGGVISCW
jgi:hypothetical protein